ncbi:MAG: radical SAM protein [Planctomycetes bacterium]|nr:radical SAM protein [Planctomycetota bacterium]
MPPTVYGLCENCKQHSPATHFVRDGKVFIRKVCPTCGPGERLVSSDAAVWQRKRDLWHYDPEKIGPCAINCLECAHAHHPRMVFLDVTNRCNMNCPICINNTPSMGFLFEPPLDYFDKVLAGLAAMDPPPTVQLFGGEPTVRKDLFDIIALCNKRGLRVRIVTNGLKLADPDYCKRLCDAKVPVLLAFDGPDPEIYERLRKNPGALEKKLKALENLKRFSSRKNTIMVCVARKINDRHMGGLIRFCHDNRRFITALHLIPLTETWKEGEFETDVNTTIEDVEHIIDDAIPDEKVDFVPAGLGYKLDILTRFFTSTRLTFGGVHPNCESMTLLLSDGERYHALSHYLKRPLHEVAEEIVTLAERLGPGLEKLDPKRLWQRLRGQWRVVRAAWRPVRRSLDFRRILRGRPFFAVLRILAALAIGRKGKDVLRRHTRVQDALRMIVLPFEEYHSIDGSRLRNCTAGFAFEDPDTGEVRTIPVCSFSLYKNDVQRKLAAKYGSTAPRNEPAACPV